MSEGRRLWIRFRRIAAGSTGAYGEAIAEADRLATGLASHFWAFEVEGRERLFVEFLEGPSDVALEALDAKSARLLATAGGAEGKEAAAVEVAVGPQGLRCSEAAAPG